MSRSSKSGAVSARQSQHRHPLVAAFNLFLDTRFFAGLPAPCLKRWSLRLLVLTAVLMALSQAENLAERFTQTRHQVQGWRLFHRAIGGTYQGLVKALTRASPRLLRAVGDHLRAQVQRVAGDHWMLGPWVVMGVDGSKFDLRRNQALLDSFGKAGKKACRPQAFVTTILHLATGLPWDARIGRADASERAHLHRMVRHLPAQTLLVADAGFVGYAFWSLLLARQVHFLIRVGANVSLLKGLGYGVRESGDLVFLWPDRERKNGRKPLVLRLIRLHNGRQEMCLLTSVLDPKPLSVTQAMECYKLRWGIELWYRQLKQTASRAKLASAAPGQATLELAWLLVAMALLGLLGVDEALRRGQDPLALSPSGTLGALRALAQQPRLHGGLRTLRRTLGHCMKDRRLRQAPKCRQAWPAKKRNKPPGTPKITEASPAQVAAAAEL